MSNWFIRASWSSQNSETVGDTQPLAEHLRTVSDWPPCGAVLHDELVELAYNDVQVAARALLRALPELDGSSETHTSIWLMPRKCPSSLQLFFQAQRIRPCILCKRFMGEMCLPLLPVAEVMVRLQGPLEETSMIRPLSVVVDLFQAVFDAVEAKPFS